MANRVANTRELVLFIRPTSCLGASLVEFELFIHELCRFGLPDTKIDLSIADDRRCQCSRSRVLPLYTFRWLNFRRRNSVGCISVVSSGVINLWKITLVNLQDF